MIGPRPGDPQTNPDSGPFCPCGEWRTRSIHTPLCPLCADRKRLEDKAAMAAIGHSRFANIWQRRNEEVA